MFDCSQIYITPQPDVHVSPNLLPKDLPQPHSPAPQPSAFQPQRASLSPSDPASTTFSSDNERVFSSGDEDSLEFQSDTAYDSVATRATMSSNSGLPGLEIERLFDETPPEATKHSFLPLEDLIPHGPFGELSQHDATSLDGLDSLSTPRDDQSSNQDVEYLATPVAARENQSLPENNNPYPPLTASSKGLWREQSDLEPISAGRGGVAIPPAAREIQSQPENFSSGPPLKLCSEDVLLEQSTTERIPAERERGATPVAPPEHHSLPEYITSSPPLTPYSGSLLRVQAQMESHPAERPDLARCSGQPWDEDVHLDYSSEDQVLSPDLPQHIPPRLSPSLVGAYQPSLPHHRQELDDMREERRLSIFDWSEQQRSDRDSLYGSSPRPRTMHSKQGNDGRGGRGPGRRAPNALHLRSQSVPAAKESYMDSDPAYPPAKFGTWGLGNKGVSEEWTDDFEFDEDDYDAQQGFEPSVTGMKVPQAIIDRQASVHGQFGQVQEFMLLVQELKRLRHQGTVLELMGGSSHHLWEDAESIINLATLNEDDEELIPPQSPGFPGSFDDFEDDLSPASRPWQQCNPSIEDGLKAIPTSMLNSIPATPPTGRPRGESLAQAKQFLQTMHQNRTGTESSPFDDRSHPPKLPFDTQDLRDLVTRTGVVTRALKDIVRKAEGVLISPDGTPKEPRDPPFSQIFKRPEDLSPSSKKPGLPKSTSLNSYINGSLASSTDDRDRSGHMNMMTVT
jgi:Septation protein etd1